MSKCENLTKYFASHNSFCKDCIHTQLCIWKGTLNDPNEHCKLFKDKSLFVELPCAIGQKVYVIEVCHCYNDIYANECHIRRTKASKYIERRCLPYKHHTRCAKLYERAFKIEHLNKLGKTVFLDRAEAERKLREVGE